VSALVNLMYCVVSIDASRLTTLIVAGCENVTDTFLLTCFLTDVSTRVNLLSSNAVSSVQERARAATIGGSSCQTAYGQDVVSQQSFCHKLNQSDGSASFRHKCAADVCRKEVCNSVALRCVQRWSINYDSSGADTPMLLPFVADHIVSHSSVDAGVVRGCRSSVSCGRMNQAAAEHCSRITDDDHSCIAKSYKLECLDVSGCWKITDVSVRSV